MRRFTSIEICTLMLATMFMVVGTVLVIHPTEVAWPHPTTDPASAMPGSYVEVISKKGARVYGALGVVLGTGLAIFVIFPKPKRQAR